jgi:predicted transport protein
MAHLRKLENRILELDVNIEFKDNTKNVAFSISKIFAELKIRTKNIRIYLRGLKEGVKYNDPKNRIIDLERYRWVFFKKRNRY